MGRSKFCCSANQTLACSFWHLGQSRGPHAGSPRGVLVAVLAGVITVALRLALFTEIELTAETLRGAGFNVLHSPAGSIRWPNFSR